ncbi:MAG: ribosome recycling factor [Oscillospiraceae bacterium]|jgi:ribosome recycling factor|nr:ribosome recycling factor [Oscillospiraceae bacterium]
MGSYPEIEDRIAKTLEMLGHSYATIRAGRASAAVLERVSVDYYGVTTPVAQIASVSTPEPRVLVIQPWDASVLKAVEKAIQASDLGINPTNDGKVIRLAFPQLTEERRKELTRLVHKYGEEAKVAVRNIRRDAIEAYKKQQKKSEITEDDLRDTERDVQELTDNAVRDIDALTAKKEKELMEV